MKIKLLIICFLIANNSFSQKLGVFYNSDFYQYKFNDVVLNGYPTEHHYKNKQNYSIGMSFELNKNLDYLGKLSYSKKGYKLKYKFSTLTPDPVPLPDFCKIQANYIDVSIGIGKPVIKHNDINLIPHIFFTTSFLFYSCSKMTNTAGEESILNGDGYCLTPQNLEKFLYNTSIDLKFEYTLNKHISIFIQPAMSYYLIKIEKDVIKQNPWAWHIGGGITLKLKKKENES